MPATRTLKRGHPIYIAVKEGKVNGLVKVKPGGRMVLYQAGDLWRKAPPNGGVMFQNMGVRLRFKRHKRCVDIYLYRLEDSGRPAAVVKSADEGVWEFNASGIWRAGEAPEATGGGDVNGVSEEPFVGTGVLYELFVGHGATPKIALSFAMEFARGAEHLPMRHLVKAMQKVEEHELPNVCIEIASSSTSYEVLRVLGIPPGNPWARALSNGNGNEFLSVMKNLAEILFDLSVKETTNT